MAARIFKSSSQIPFLRPNTSVEEFARDWTCSFGGVSNCLQSSTMDKIVDAAKEQTWWVTKISRDRRKCP